MPLSPSSTQLKVCPDADAYHAKLADLLGRGLCTCINRSDVLPHLRSEADQLLVSNAECTSSNAMLTGMLHTQSCVPVQ